MFPLHISLPLTNHCQNFYDKLWQPHADSLELSPMGERGTLGDNGSYTADMKLSVRK